MVLGFGSSLAITDLSIENCHITTPEYVLCYPVGPWIAGAARLNYYGNLYVRNISVLNNSVEWKSESELIVWSAGGGLCSFGGTSTLLHSSFANNKVHI